MPLAGHTLRAGRRRDPWTFSGLKLQCIVRQRGKPAFTLFAVHPRAVFCWAFEYSAVIKLTFS